MNADEIVLDDGEFYMELNGNYAAFEAPGFLHRRCGYGLTTPGGYECLGSFAKTVDGTWRADVAAPLDRDTDSDCTVVAERVSRMDSIAALWVNRNLAYSTHD